MEPFRPYGADGETMGYYEVPIGVLEAADELRTWVRDAVAVAQRSAVRKSTVKNPKSKTNQK